MCTSSVLVICMATKKPISIFKFENTYINVHEHSAKYSTQGFQFHNNILILIKPRKLGTQATNMSSTYQRPSKTKSAQVQQPSINYMATCQGCKIVQNLQVQVSQPINSHTTHNAQRYYKRCTIGTSPNDQTNGLQSTHNLKCHKSSQPSPFSTSPTAKLLQNLSH